MRPLILAVMLATLVPFLAHAGCSDDATALAKKYGITANLAADASSTTTEKLAKSGGVIAPPATGDLATSSPAMPNPEPMKTAPDLPPQTASGAMEHKNATGEPHAAVDTQAASLLQAAKAAGAKGDEASCQQHLADARALLQKTPGVAQ